MRIAIEPRRSPPKHGAAVRVGNVYVCGRAPALGDFRVVVGVIGAVRGRHPWNCVVLVHFDGEGAVVGASRQPERYVSEHWDLVGRAREMPTLGIEWLG